MKRRRFARGVFFIVFAFPLAVNATRLIGTDHFAVPSDTVINDDLIIGAKEAEVAGTVTGDLIFGGNGLSQTGAVKGSVWAGGKSIQLRGPISASARVFSSRRIRNSSDMSSLFVFCVPAPHAGREIFCLAYLSQ